MKKIIWFTEWYPVDFEPYNGDQVERLAQAASLYNHIHVVYVKKDPQLLPGQVKKEERRYNKNCSAVIWYYPQVRQYGKWVDKIFSSYYFFKLHLKAVKDYRTQLGRPDGIQVNISMRNGLMALWYKLFSGLKYIVLERWGIYLPNAQSYWKGKGFMFSYFTKMIFKKASQALAVSADLAEILKKDMQLTSCAVIPNVVDSSVFFYKTISKNHDRLRFIHISNLDYAKNVREMLKGFKNFLESGYKADLIMHTPFSNELTLLINEFGLTDNIIVKPEVSQPHLAESIREADALILFSRYETFGIVAIEAQACGVPVITSNYPVFNETVQHKVNGIIASGSGANALTAAMVEFVKYKEEFNPEAIAAAALDKYSYNRIGKMLDDVYNSVFTA